MAERLCLELTKGTRVETHLCETMHECHKNKIFDVNLDLLYVQQRSLVRQFETDEIYPFLT